MSEAKTKTSAAKKTVGPKKADGAKAAKGGARITVVQVKSGMGRFKAQQATLKGLGLGKLHRKRELEDTPAVRGMISAVQHLVRVEK